MLRTRMFAALSLFALLGLPAVSAHADRWVAGGHLLYAEPRASFAAVVDRGFGLQGFGVFNLDPTGVIGIRLDGGIINYGNEEQTVPLSNTVQRVFVKITTSNNIGMLGIGPQLSVPVGPVRPYAYATIGLGYFFTESSVKGNDGSNQPFASSTNFDDSALSNSFGGGMMIPVARLVSIDLGAEYRRHRNVRYLAAGDVFDNPGGTPTLRVRESDADLMVYRMGVTFSTH